MYETILGAPRVCGGLALLVLSVGVMGCTRDSSSGSGSTSASVNSGVPLAPSTPSPAQPVVAQPPASAELRTIGLDGAYFNQPAGEVVICSFDEDLASLNNVRLQIDTGAGFVDSTLPVTRLYFALNNQAHYSGNAGFLNFNDRAVSTQSRRYRVLAERGGVALVSNTVTTPASTQPQPVWISEPRGAYSLQSQPTVNQVTQLSWSPQSTRSLVTLYRVQAGPGVQVPVITPESVFEVDSSQHTWGSPAITTWVAGRVPLPQGDYALDVMNIDANGWVTGWSTDMARGAEAFYRFNLR